MKLAKIAALAKIVLLGIVICCLAGQAIRPAVDSSSQVTRQQLTTQLTNLSIAVRAFVHDRNANKPAAAKADAKAAMSIWANLPQAVKERLEMRHPGSAEILEDLDGQLPTTTRPSTCPASKPASMPASAPNLMAEMDAQQVGAPGGPASNNPGGPITINSAATGPSTLPCQVNVTSILGISLDETDDAKPSK